MSKKNRQWSQAKSELVDGNNQQNNKKKKETLFGEGEKVRKNNEQG